MADIIGAIKELLKADAELGALVDGRGYGDELPPDETKHMPRNCFVVRPSGGASLTGGSYVEHDTQRIDVVAYGATPYEADAIRRRAAIALRAVKRQVVNGVLIHWANSAGGFMTGRDRDGKWPYAFQSFQVFHALNEVP